VDPLFTEYGCVLMWYFRTFLRRDYVSAVISAENMTGNIHVRENSWNVGKISGPVVLSVGRCYGSVSYAECAVWEEVTQNSLVM
jgi:hypothetical protein